MQSFAYVLADMVGLEEGNALVNLIAKIILSEARVPAKEHKQIMQRLEGNTYIATVCTLASKRLIEPSSC